MSGIVGQIGARSGTLDSGGLPSAGTVTQSGTTQLDYETGEWTPDSTEGGVDVSGDQLYIKLGRLVMVRGYVHSGTSVGLASWSLTGLPFPVSEFFYGTGQFYNTNVGSETSTMNVRADPSTHAIFATISVDNTAWDTLAYADITTGHVGFTISYMTT